MVGGADMSYCRISDGSDVYVIGSNVGLECIGCNFVCDTPAEMLAHLFEHRRSGDCVPQSAITRLCREVLSESICC